MAFPEDLHSPLWIPGFPLGSETPVDAQELPGPRCCFATASSLGGIRGSGPVSGWHLDAGLPPDLHVRSTLLLHNAFRLRFHSGPDLRMVCVSPGLWLGEMPANCRPELFVTGASVQHEPHFSHAEIHDHSLGFLQSVDGPLSRCAFGVLAGSPDEVRARLTNALADSALAERVMDASLAERALWYPRLNLSPQENGGLAMEFLAGSLEKGWPSDNGTPLPLNALLGYLPLIARLFPERFLALTKLLLEMPGLPDGALPSFPGSPLPAWPLLAQLLVSLPPDSLNPQLTAKLAQRCEQHLRFYLKSWNPQEQRLPAWPSPDAAFTPEVIDDSIDSVDLSALLVAEINALARLDAHSTPFSSERELLRTRLLKEFWSSPQGAFADKVRGGDFVKRGTLGAVLPLLWDDLPTDKRKALWKRLASAGGLKGPLGLRQWEARPQDPVEPPLRCEVQQFFVPLLKTAPLDVATALVEAWSQQPPATQVVEAAFALQLPGLRSRVDLALGRWPAWIRFLEQQRKVIVPAAAAVILLIPALFGLVFSLRPELSALQQANLSGHAESLAALKRFGEAEETYTQLITLSRHSASIPIYLQLRGNSRFRQERYAEALADYEEALRLDPTSPLVGARWNQAQSLNRLGRNPEAVEVLRTLAEEVDENVPGLATRIENAILLFTP